MEKRTNELEAGGPSSAKEKHIKHQPKKHRGALESRNLPKLSHPIKKLDRSLKKWNTYFPFFWAG